MQQPTEPAVGAWLDASDRSALERTTYAWLRTALAVVALGFIIARLGYYLAEIAAATGVQVPYSGLAVPIGLCHILVGLALVSATAMRYAYAEREKRAGRDGLWLGRYFVVATTAASVVGGATLAVYLLAAWPE
jgi:uncharacterized membrane protein YidH (DUF202 family)